MPLATPEQYREMLDAAHSQEYAFPAVNVSSSSTLNAALRGLAEARSDGIIQVSIGAAEFASGAPSNPALGARALAAHAHLVADRYPVLIALHTDHCQADKLDTFVRPLLAESLERRARGELPLYHSHMFDGSTLPLEENLRIAVHLLAECRAADVILELEIGLVGGEEDELHNDSADPARFYSTPADALAVAEALGTGERGRYLLAATFGNVHGVYSAINARLRPEILRELRDAVTARFGEGAAFDFVFHGGSGSATAKVTEAIRNGVVKMNIDTDMQYAYTRAVADHVFRNYDGVLKIEGGVGDKKSYDPRRWGRAAETAMADRVHEAARRLGSAGRTQCDPEPPSKRGAIPLHPEATTTGR
jgi:fructose-bisphosphate aldolase, class II